MNLIFQVQEKKYCSLQHQTDNQTHLQVSIISALAHCFFLSGTIINCPLLFPSSILDTFQPEGLIFWCHAAAAAAPKSLQSCPTLCDPIRRQPTSLPHPWDSPDKSTGVGCHFLFQCRKVKSESEVAQLCPTLATPWTAAYQAPLSMGFSRQKYWSGVPLPSPSGVITFCLFIHVCSSQKFYYSQKFLRCVCERCFHICMHC